MSFAYRAGLLASALSYLFLGLLPVARAQDWNQASTLYSQGVHAYFGGRSGEAESYFSRALSLETADPRIYYFRALSLMRQGRMDEARGDMMVGADLEARHPGRFAVGTALLRVQGGNRLLLEQYRRQGRSDDAANRAQSHRDRYPQTFDEQSQVLRQRIIIPLDQLMQPGGPKGLTAEEFARIAPPATHSPGGATTSAATGITREVAKPAGEDPFRDDPAPPATPPTAADLAPPQGEPNDTPPEEPAPAETEAAPESESETEDLDDDPFSGFE